MKTIGLTALAAVVALVLGFGAHLGSATPANAAVTGTSAIYCGFLASAIDGDTTNVTTAGDLTAACDGLTSTGDNPLTASVTETGGEMQTLAATLGDKAAPLTASDLTSVDLDANQVTKGGTAGGNASLYLFAFTDDQANVQFNAPTGITAVNNDGVAFATPEVCTTEDADCDPSAPAANADGVVVARVDAGSAAVGASLGVAISQPASGTATTETINVVGPPLIVNLTLAKSTLQAAASSADVTTCTTGTDVTDSTALSSPSSTVAIATVTDSGGNKVTRAPVALTSSSTGKASIAVGAVATGITGNTGISVDGGTAGIASFAVVCAGTSTGTATITASVNAGADTSTADVTVVGVPSAVALTAAPASIDCNGTSTSTVTAKVTDSAGNNVADGTPVTFSVVALGTANPITAKTTAGTATSTITPLSANAAGVTVNVTAGSGAAASILVSCNLASPTVPAGAAPTATPPGGVIGGPNTGTGGYLGQDGSSSFPMWAILALAAGSLVLLGGGVVARRAGK